MTLLGVIQLFRNACFSNGKYRRSMCMRYITDFIRNINGTGPLATNGIEAGVKIRPTEDELNMMDSWPCPEFRSGWDSYFKDKPDKPVMHYSVIAGWFGDHMVMPPGKFFTMFRKLKFNIT